jgi:hypothetical protein
METAERWLALAATCFVALCLFLFFAVGAHSRDLGQWENTDPEISQWYRSLKQPDNPTASCCGEADGYWCDEIHVKHGATFCTITDDRPNEPLRRTPVPIGTKAPLPRHRNRVFRS